MKVMTVMICLAFLLCTIVFIYLTTRKKVLSATKYTVVLLVASIPHSIEIIASVILFIGSWELSRHGTIVTRLAAIEDMAGMSVLCSGKTGILTMNKMEIQEKCRLYNPPECDSLNALLCNAALATKWKAPQRDELDKMVVNAVLPEALDKFDQIVHRPFDQKLKRSEGKVRDLNTGKVFKVTKGPPNVISNLVLRDKKHRQSASTVELDVYNFGLRGIRCLGVAKTDDEGKWMMLGLLTFLDPPRQDAKKSILEAYELGIAIKMITGDHELVAMETARSLQLGTYLVLGQNLPSLDPITRGKPEDLSKNYGDLCVHGDVFAQGVPGNKYLVVECLQDLGHKVGLTGRGMHDAPAMKAAGLGVAVAGATDAARSAADIVLTLDGLSTLIDGIRVSRRIIARIKVFMIYRLAATLELLTFHFISVFAFNPSSYQPAYITKAQKWPDVFEMPVLMLLLISLINDGKECHNAV